MDILQKMNEKLLYVYSNYICRSRKSNSSDSTQMTWIKELTTKIRGMQLYEVTETQDEFQSTGTDLDCIEDPDTLESTR